MSKHYGKHLSCTVSPQTLWHLRRLARMSGYGDQIGRVVDKLTRERFWNSNRNEVIMMSAQGIFEIDPYIRDRLIRFLKEYVYWEDGQEIDVLMVSPEQVIRQSILFLIKQKVFTYQEMSVELRHYGLRLSADQLQRFAMQGYFLR